MMVFVSKASYLDLSLTPKHIQIPCTWNVKTKSSIKVCALYMLTLNRLHLSGS